MDAVLRPKVDAAWHLLAPELIAEVLAFAEEHEAEVNAYMADYQAELDRQCAAYCERIMALPDMVAWRSAALLEPEELEELDMEF